MTISQSKIGEIKKSLSGGVGQQDLSKNAIKKELGSKTVVSYFLPAVLSQSVLFTLLLINGTSTPAFCHIVRDILSASFAVTNCAHFVIYSLRHIISKFCCHVGIVVTRGMLYGTVMILGISFCDLIFIFFLVLARM